MKSGAETRPQDRGSSASAAEASVLDPRLLARLIALQFEINCASSVAIEIPSLRPYAEALRAI